MTLDSLIDLLRGHLAALQSSWPGPHGPAQGPALYLDEADTRAALAELIRLRIEVAIMDGLGYQQPVGSGASTRP